MTQIQNEVKTINPIQDYKFQNHSGLTKALLVLLYIGIALIALNVLDSIMSYNLYSSAQYIDISDEQIMGNDNRTLLIAVVAMLVNIATIVVFLIWINRANKNSRALGAQNMQFTPGWCVGWWFIPIASLWKPYQAVREIWKTSKKIDNWQTQENSTIALWWTLWIISGIVSQIITQWSSSIYYDYDATLIDYQNIELAWIFTSIFDIALSIIFIKIIREICNRQLTQFQNQSQN